MSSPADTTASSPTGQHLWLLLFSLINRLSSMSPWFRSCVWIGSLDIDLNHQISASNGLSQSHHLFQSLTSECTTTYQAKSQRSIEPTPVCPDLYRKESPKMTLRSWYYIAWVKWCNQTQIRTPPSTVYYNRVRELTAQRRLPNGWRLVRTLNRYPLAEVTRGTLAVSPFLMPFMVIPF